MIRVRSFCWLVVCLLAAVFTARQAVAQPTPPSQATLMVNATTGAVTGPISLATFKDANGLNAGTGTVTSVGLALPVDLFTVSNSPVTTSGTLTAALATQSANYVWAGPTTGSAAAPSFRLLVAADIPDLSAIYQPLNASLTQISAGTWAGASSITTLGTIATGTWSATAIADGKIASALTGKTYNGLTLTSNATGWSIAGGTTSKTLTLSNSLTLAGNDATTLNIGGGGTLGSAAFTAASAYDVAGAAAAAQAASQPLDSDLTAIAALSTTANGRALLTASALTAAGLGLTNGSTIDAWGAVTNSSGLAGRLSDETGSGAAVFGTSPTITTPTISSITAASATDFVASGGSSGASLTLGQGGANQFSALGNGQFFAVGGTHTLGDHANVFGMIGSDDAAKIDRVLPAVTPTAYGFFSGAAIQLKGNVADVAGTATSGIFTDDGTTRTITSGRSLWVRDLGKGSNTTVTTMYGLDIEAPTIGATNVGFRNAGTTILQAATTATSITASSDVTSTHAGDGFLASGISDTIDAAPGYKFGSGTSISKWQASASGDADLWQFNGSWGRTLRMVRTSGNLLIGGTTDISGSGGLKVFGTTAATNTTSGALQVGTGIGMGGGNIYASGIVNAGTHTGNGSVPTGGTTGQVLAKSSSGDYALTWSSASGTSQLVIPLVNAPFTNLPASVGFWAGSTGHQFGVKVDLTNYTQVRLTVNKQGVAGAAGSKVILRYYTSLSTTASNYLDIGTSEVSIAVDTSTVQILDTGWINLAAGAKADVVIMPLGSGGDGVTDPTFGSVVAEFK